MKKVNSLIKSIFVMVASALSVFAVIFGCTLFFKPKNNVGGLGANISASQISSSVIGDNNSFVNSSVNGEEFSSGENLNISGSIVADNIFAETSQENSISSESVENMSSASDIFIDTITPDLGDDDANVEDNTESDDDYMSDAFATYTVFFANFDGSAPLQQTRTIGVTFSVTNKTKYGYTFTGWTISSGAATINSSAKANGTSWSGLTPVKGTSSTTFYNLGLPGGSVTLYANWSNNYYTISYRGAAVCSSMNLIIEIGDNLDTRLKSVLKGITVYKWQYSTSASGTYVTLSNTSTSSYTNFCTTVGSRYYFKEATYTMHTYNIIYDYNGGTKSSSYTELTECTYGTFYASYFSTAATRTGYTFSSVTISGACSCCSHYHSIQNFGGTEYTGTTYDITSFIDMYFLAQLNCEDGANVTVTFNWNPISYYVQPVQSPNSSVTQYISLYNTGLKPSVEYDEDAGRNIIYPNMSIYYTVTDGYYCYSWYYYTDANTTPKFTYNLLNLTTTSGEVVYVYPAAANIISYTLEAGEVDEQDLENVSLKSTITPGSNNRISASYFSDYSDMMADMYDVPDGYYISKWQCSIGSTIWTTSSLYKLITMEDWDRIGYAIDVRPIEISLLTYYVSIDFDTSTTNITSFNDLSGNAENTYMDVVYGTAKYIPRPERHGYSFSGWTISGITATSFSAGNTSSTSVNVSSSLIVDGTCTRTSNYTYYKNLSIEKGSVVTFTANWTAYTYYVQFDLDDGEDPLLYSANYDEPLYITASEITSPTRVGYKFNGWTITDINYHTYKSYSGTANYEHNSHYYDISSGSTTYFDSTTATIPGFSSGSSFYNLHCEYEESVTFTANWEPITYTIYFYDPNIFNVTVSPEPTLRSLGSTITATYGVDYTEEAIALYDLQAGYKITRWRYLTDYLGYNEDDLEYDGYYTSSFYNLTAVDGDSVFVIPNDVSAITYYINLYPREGVTFLDNSGASSQTYYYGSVTYGSDPTADILSHCVANDNYIIDDSHVYFYIQDSYTGSYTRVTDLGTLTTEDGYGINIFVEAYYTYTIYFDGDNFGTVVVPFYNATEDEILDLNAFTSNVQKTGYYVHHWEFSTTANFASFTNLNLDDEVSNLTTTPGGKVYLRSIFYEIIYNIDIDLNESYVQITSFGIDTNFAVSYSAEVYIPIPTAHGYTFDGWKISNLGNETFFRGMDSGDLYSWDPDELEDDGSAIVDKYIDYFQYLHIENDAVVNFEAIWIEHTYNINYVLNDASDGNGSTEATAYSSNPTSVSYSQEFDVFEPTRIGYTFLGWNVSGASSHTYTNRIGVTLNCSHDIMPNGGFTTATFEINYNKNPEYFYDAANGKKTLAFKHLTCENGATVTLTAIWEAITYNIAYVYNGTGFRSNGIVSSRPSTVTFDQEFQLYTNNFYRHGYTVTSFVISNISTSCDAYAGTVSGSLSTITLQDGLFKTINSQCYFKNLQCEQDATVTFTIITQVNTYKVQFKFINISIANNYYVGGLYLTQFNAYNSGKTKNATYLGDNQDGYSIFELLVDYNEEFFVEAPIIHGYTVSYWGSIVGVSTDHIKYYSNSDTSSFVSVAAANTMPADSWRVNSWYKNLQCTTNSVVTFSIAFMQNSYNIVYDLNKGTGSTDPVAGADENGNANPEGAAYGSTVKIYNPTRYGYTFAGWTITGMSSHSFVDIRDLSTTLNCEHKINGVDSTSDTATSNPTEYGEYRNLHCEAGATVTFTASWTPITYKVKYDIFNNSRSYLVTSFGDFTTEDVLGEITNLYFEQEVEFDSVFQVPTPIAYGYTFSSWNLAGLQTTIDYGMGGATLTYSNSGASLENITYISYKNLQITQDAEVSFIANWTENTYNISYELNGGSVATANPTSTNYTTRQTINTPTKHGYTFASWTVSNAVFITYTRLDTGAISTRINPGYNYNGAWYGIEEDPQTLTIVDREGNICTSMDVKLLNPEDGATVTFTANWSANNYWVHFNAIGNAKTTQLTSFTATSASYDSTLLVYKTKIAYNSILTVANPEFHGYTFVGWKITNISNCCNTYSTSGASFANLGKISSIDSTKDTRFKNLQCTTDEIVLFEAIWQENTYNITYSLNSGSLASGETNPTSAKILENITVISPTRHGYTFTGWTLTGLATDTFTVLRTDTNTTHSYNVSFGSTTGYLTGATQTFTEDGVASSTYTFLHCEEGATVTFTANWRVNNYWVHFDAIGNAASDELTSFSASITGTVFTAVYDSALECYKIQLAYGSILSVSNPTFHGYTFAGWNVENISDCCQTYNGSAWVTISSLSSTTATSFNQLQCQEGAIVTFTAVWTENTYNIVYDLNKGAASTTPVAGKDGDGNANPESGILYTESITIYSPTRHGYTFTGWTISGLANDTFTVIPSNTSKTHGYNVAFGTTTGYLTGTTQTFTEEGVESFYISIFALRARCNSYIYC